MKITGIIAEYNPFHNGHKYHIEKSKEITNSEFCIVVMSSNYVQRGEPAVINKWTRTKMALLNGADLVIELPVHFAPASAEFFAMASISILNSTGIVDNVCFGSELGNIHELNDIASILAFEPKEFKSYLNTYLVNGLNFPTARTKALEEYYISNNKTLNNSIIQSPNNILGIEYLKSLKRLDSSITPYTITRKGSNYHDENSNTPFASATAIRKQLFKNDSIEKLELMLPSSSYKIITEEINNYKCPIFHNDIYNLLRYKLLVTPNNDLENICDVTEGIQNRIISCLEGTTSIKELVEKVSTKRFTNTKINRALLHILLNLKKDEFQAFINNGYCQYIKILGFNSKSKLLLKKLKDNSNLPIVSNVKDSERKLHPLGRKMLQDEIRCTNIYNTLIMNKYNTYEKNDYTQPIIII
jgi:predicted nucleotidyltransferase